MTKGIWTELEQKRAAAMTAQIADGRGRKSLVVSAAEQLQDTVQDGDSGIVSIVLRDGLGKRAAQKFEDVQRENAARAGMDPTQWFVGQELDESGKIQVTLSYLIPVRVVED